MKRRALHSAELALVAALCASAVAAGPADGQRTEGPGQAADLYLKAVVYASFQLSGESAELTFEVDDGSQYWLRFFNGTIELNAVPIGSYLDGGGLDSAWRDFLREYAGRDGTDVLGGLIQLRSMLDQSDDWAHGSADVAGAEALAGHLDRIFKPNPAPPVAAEGSGTEESSLVIVPGNMGYDAGGALDRLGSALVRLGVAGEAAGRQLAMIVHDDYVIPSGRTVGGSVALVGGTLHLAGSVEGDLVLLDGELVLAENAVIGGSLLQAGGEVDFGESAIVMGDILSDIPLAPAPELPGPAAQSVFESHGAGRHAPHSPGLWSRFTSNVVRALEGLGAALFTFVIFAVIGILFVLFGRRRVETVSDAVLHSFVRSFVMGLAGQVLFLPAVILLVLSVVGIPVALFLLAATPLAGLVGYIAVAHVTGQVFARRRYRNEWLARLGRPNSYYHIIGGLAILLLPFAASSLLWVLGGAADVVRGLICVVAIIGTWVLATAGFGAVLLTRVGGRSVVVSWAGNAGADGDAANPRDGAEEA